MKFVKKWTVINVLEKIWESINIVLRPDITS